MLVVAFFRGGILGTLRNADRKIGDEAHSKIRKSTKGLRWPGSPSPI